MNPYQVLGVEKTATTKEIKSSYRKLSKEHHPDKGGDRAKFEEIKLAFDVLSDSERRKRYDETGRIDKSPVTPEVIRQMIAETMKAVVNAQRPDGTTDDPTWEDIRRKILLTIQDNMRNVRNNIRAAQQKLDRTNKLIKRFKSKTDADPVGESLQLIKSGIEEELRREENTLELQEKMIESFNSYDYEVDPQPEGQYDQGPTVHPRRGGPMFLSASRSGL